MAVLRPPKKEKIIAGFIYSSPEDYAASSAILAEKFGAMDFDSGEQYFEHTDYYEAEMGKNLKRRFVSFSALADPSELCAIKIFTNSVEEEFLFPGTAFRAETGTGFHKKLHAPDIYWLIHMGRGDTALYRGFVYHAGMDISGLREKGYDSVF
jgi:hypothetical protein